MHTFYGWFKKVAVCFVLLTASTGALALPEIPFCPLGGPPGWMNRIFDDDDHDYPPPVFYPPPHAAPHWGPVMPYYPAPVQHPYPPPLIR